MYRRKRDYQLTSGSFSVKQNRKQSYNTTENWLINVIDVESNVNAGLFRYYNLPSVRC